MQQLIVNPKISAYNSKKLEEKLLFKRYVVEQINKFSPYFSSIGLIREDLLVYEYYDSLNPKQTVWYNTLSDATVKMYESRELLPSSHPYFKVQGAYNSKEIKRSLIKYPLPKIDDNSDKLKEDTDQEIKRVLGFRTKDIIEYYISKAECVLLIRDSSNFTSLHKGTIGDGKLIIIIDTLRQMNTVYYGGMLVKPDLLKTLLERIKSKGERHASNNL